MTKVRTREPNRGQVTFRVELPEDALPIDHPARVLWRLVGQMDLSKLLDGRLAVEGQRGRDVLSVRMLLTLWLYATSVNIGSAREIARRTTVDAGFMWIVGDQKVAKSTLAAFRVSHGDALDQLMTDVLASLMHRDLISLDLVGQDGTRVRASASPPSFRRAASLEECREQAALHLKAVLAAEDGGLGVRALREAKARDFCERVDAAIAEVERMTERRQGGTTPRASTTHARRHRATYRRAAQGSSG